MRIFTHLIGEALGKLFGAFGAAILFAVIGGGAVLGYAYNVQHSWPPSILTEVVAGVIGVLAGYAAAVTAILRALGQTLLGATKAVEDEAEKVLKP